MHREKPRASMGQKSDNNGNFRFVKVQLVTFAFLLVVCSLAAADYDVDVESVQVWVQARDGSGDPVANLNREDFEIYEDGTLRSVQCFETADRRQEAGERPNLPLESSGDVLSFTPPQRTRRLAVFLDLFNVSPAEYIRLKPVLREFLGRLNDRDWRVVIAALTAEGKLRISREFSGGLSEYGPLLDHAPANRTRDERTNSQERELDSILRCGRPDSQTVRGAYALARRFTEEQYNWTLLSIRALEQFVNHMQAQSNRDHLTVLYLSGGFTVEPGRKYYNTIEKYCERLSVDPTRMEDVINYPYREREGKFDVHRELRDSIGRLNRNNVTVYAISSRGLPESLNDPTSVTRKMVELDTLSSKDYQDGLARIANETGGLVFENSSNFRAGLGQILRDFSAYYLLCYDPLPDAEQRKYHEIQVTCSRPDVHLRYRRGYK